MPYTPPPCDAGLDFAVMIDGLETVTVVSRDPDTGATLFTASSVTALRGPVRYDETAVGEGGAVGVTYRDWTIIASGLSFTPKARDLLTDADGVTWVLGKDVKIGGFGKLYDCKDSVKQR